MSCLRAIRATLRATATDGVVCANPKGTHSWSAGLRLVMDHADRLVLERTLSVSFADGTNLQFRVQHRRLFSWRTDRPGTSSVDTLPGRTDEALKPDDAVRVAESLRSLCEQSSIVRIESDAISGGDVPTTPGLAPASILRQSISDGTHPAPTPLQDRIARLADASDLNVKAAFLLTGDDLSVLHKSQDANDGLSDHATAVLNHVTANGFVLAYTLETVGALSFHLPLPIPLHVLVVGHIGSLGVVYCSGCSDEGALKAWQVTS